MLTHGVTYIEFVWRQRVMGERHDRMGLVTEGDRLYA